MRAILYITYDGLTDSLGQSQILAYLKRISSEENKIVILSFEKPEAFSKEETRVRKIVEQANLVWMPLTYSKRPPVVSTLYDIYKGNRACDELMRQYRFSIVHCRGYVPSIMGRRLQKKWGAKFIFDMRGWWPDEKKESGFWNSKMYEPVYRYFKKLERSFFHHADHIVSLTYKGKDEIVRQGFARPEKIGVIPTCVDFDIFKPADAEYKQQKRRELGIMSDENVFVYSGCVGGNYDENVLINVFKAYQQLYTNSYLLILSKDVLSEAIKQKFEAAGIKRIAIYNSPFSEVTNYLRAGDVGFIFYKMQFSTIGRSPTKLGEYWASGLPVITFSGIGDLDYILQHYEGSGVLLGEDESRWKEQISSQTFATSKQLREYSSDYFHISKGIEFYSKVYEQLAPFPASLVTI